MANGTEEIVIYTRDEPDYKGDVVMSCSCGFMDKGMNILASAEQHNNTKHGGRYTIIDDRPTETGPLGQFMDSV